MKKLRKILSLTFITVLMAALFVPGIASAASKKVKMYVVSSAHVKGVTDAGVDQNYTLTYTYNKAGLFDTVTSDNESNVTQKHYYDKNYRVTKTVNTYTYNGMDYSYTLNMKYKNGKLNKSVFEYDDGSKQTVKYKWKGGVIASATIDQSYTNEQGEKVQETIKKDYKYKMGHVYYVKEYYTKGGNKDVVTKSFTMDSKGNITKCRVKKNGKTEKNWYTKAKFSYDSKGRVSGFTIKNRNLESKCVAGATATLEYKKISVDPKYKARIKAQQWGIINGVDAVNFLGMDKK
ncbi:MAG: hypothetical protein IK152_10025 [Lachnospiraceae bacterium]|nr:hypothetical protein [Lachnospiraceae bacterium]